MHDPNSVERSQALYPAFRFGSSEFCTYCGNYPDTIDHVIPVSYVAVVGRTKSRTRQYRLIGPQTYACRMCNSTLMDKCFDTFDERCLYLVSHYRERAEDTAPRWTHGELQLLDHGLKHFVINRQNLKLFYQQKAGWYWQDEYLDCINGLQYQEHLDIYHVKFHEEYYRFFEKTIRSLKKKD